MSTENQSFVTCAVAEPKRPSKDPSHVALVADDDPLRRRALGDVVGRVLPGMRVVEADSLQCLLDRLTGEKFGLVCIDLDMPGLQCDSLDQVIHRTQDAPLVFLCDSMDRGRVERIVADRRVSGVIPKSTTNVRSLESMLKIVLAGARNLPDNLGVATRAPHRSAAKLTRRQRQVLEGLALGRSTAQLADDLGISEAMVKSHVKQACVALGARNRVMAVWLAERSGLLTLPDGLLNQNSSQGLRPKGAA